jgi:O-antigen/teichoic acid export membrane protein
VTWAYRARTASKLTTRHVRSLMTRSILSNWFGLVVLAASTALLTPIMVYHVGAVNYGVWVLASSVLDYYGLLDLGMRSAMFRYVSLFRGGTLREEVDRTFSSALLLVTGTAALISVLAVAVACLLPRFITVPGTSPRMFSWLLLLLGMSVAIMFPTRMLATYISAHNRWDLYNAAGIANNVTRAVAIVVVLKLGYGILAMAIATVVVAFLSLGQHVVFLFIADPRVHVDVSLITTGRIRELFAFSTRSLLVSLGDYLRFYSDSAVIAAVLNVSLVTPFNVATRLIECFRSIVVAAGGPVFGAMTELDGGRRHEDLRDLLLRSTRFLALLSILGGVLLIVDGRALLRLWVGPGLVSAYPLVAVLAFAYMINLAQHPMLLIVIAKGRHGPLGWWSIAEGVVNIVLSIIWGMSHGLLGVAMGTIVPMLFVKIVIQPWYALKAAEMNAWEYLRKGLGRPLLVGLLFAVVAGRISVSPEPAAPLFAALVASQVMIFLAVTWFLGLTRRERLWMLEYGRKHLCWPLLGCAQELRPQRAEVVHGQE